MRDPGTSGAHLIETRDFRARSAGADLAALEPEGLVAPLADDLVRMDGEDDDFRPSLELLEPRLGLGLEALIADADHFVEEQDVRVHRGRDGEGESEFHARGIGAQRKLEILPEFAEPRDLLNPFLDVPAGHAEEESPEHDVLPPGRVFVHAERDVEERDDAPTGRDPPCGRCVDPGEHTEKRGFSCAVDTEEADPVPGAEGKVEPVEHTDRQVMGVGLEAAASADFHEVELE